MAQNQTPQPMGDKEYMQDILLTSKTLVGLYHYATQESSTEQLHNQFQSNLNDTLNMQHNIFAAMEKNGWYQTQQAEQEQVNQVKSKYTQSMQEQQAQG
ncbi:MAG: spore coat protein [Oscillospiraceae bacterium]|jgi:spore coat protein CotF|nr:spore coat protein [Oscillospiraceae bacterium]